MVMMEDLTPIPSQTAGPFLHLGCTDRHSVANLAGDAAQGEHIRIVVRVFDSGGLPVSDAMIELWQANAAGKYHHPDDTQAKPLDPAFLGFGRLATDENGACVFTTVKPGRVPGPGNNLQAPHINISVFARGLLLRLATRLYFADEPVNAEDPVLALVTRDRRETLMAKPRDQGRTEWAFDIRLSGEAETVFFDV